MSTTGSTDSDDAHSERGVARLATSMEARRVELHLSQKRAAERAEISEQTWIDTVKARRTVHRFETLIGIERALEWPAGTTNRLLRDEDVPIHGELLDTADAEAVDDETPPTDGAAFVVPADASPEVRYALGRLDQMRGRLDQMLAEVDSLRRLVLDSDDR